MNIVVSDAPLGFSVTRVLASDMDLSPALLYSFSDNANPAIKFAINQYTGVITLVEPLDFEEAAHHELWIRVSDSIYETEAQLTINILDVNDNPPVFTQDSYQVRMWQICRT